MRIAAATATMGLAALANAANTHQARDLETTLRVMNNVLDQMVKVDSTISAFWSAQDLPAVSEVGAKMVAIIRASDEEILTMQPVPLQDAIAFQPLSDKLNAQGDKLLAGVEAKIPLFGRAGVCPTMHTAVSTIGAGVVKLMNDVSDKFPQEGRQNNANTIQHFTDSFASAISKLKSCADVNNAGAGKESDYPPNTGGGSASAPPSTGGGSASAPPSTGGGSASAPPSTGGGSASAPPSTGGSSAGGAGGAGGAGANVNSPGAGKESDYPPSTSGSAYTTITPTGVAPPTPQATGSSRNGTSEAYKTPVVTAAAPSVVAKGFVAALVAALLL